MSGKRVSSSSPWRSGSSGRKSSSGRPRHALEVGRRLLIFLLTLALTWSALQFLVWPGIQPLYSGLVAWTADTVLALLEAGRRVTTLVGDGTLIHVHSELSDRDEPITSWDGNILHFYIVVFVSLFLVYPGLGARRRLTLLVLAPSVLFVFHVAAMLIKVEYLYAVEVEGLGARHYSAAEVAVYEWLHENVIFLAVQVIPALAIVFMMLIVTLERRFGREEKPLPARTGGPRRKLPILAGGALALVLLGLWLLDRKVYARQAETEARLGYEQLERRDPARASELFLSSLERAPGSIGARIGLGMCLVQEERLQDAAGEFRAVLAAEPDNADALIQLGMALHRLSDDAGAAEVLERFNAIRPKDPDGAYYLSVSLGRLGRLAEAEPILRRSLESNTESSRLLMELVRTLMLTGRRCRALFHAQRLGAMELDTEQASLVERTLAMLEEECVGGESGGGSEGE